MKDLTRDSAANTEGTLRRRICDEARAAVVAARGLLAVSIATFDVCSFECMCACFTCPVIISPY